jgi:hypothetical protein
VRTYGNVPRAILETALFSIASIICIVALIAALPGAVLLVVGYSIGAPLWRD